MIIVVLRIISLIFLIFSIIVDINVPLILHTQVNQLIIGIIIISILLLLIGLTSLSVVVSDINGSFRFIYEGFVELFIFF